MADKKLNFIIDFFTKGVDGLSKSEVLLAKIKLQIKNTKASFKAHAAGITALSTSYMALTVIIGKVKNAVKKLLTPFMNFQSTMSNLKAVSEATNFEMLKLSANALKLGISTKYTATQVGELQVEFAKLGFSADEILKVTEGTLALASAVGTDLASAAAVAGNTLKGFRLEAIETGRVTDVMAKSFSSSALDIEKFRESMKLIAPIAAAANFTIEETTALLAKLADAGLSGSIAGTSLKNIMMQLHDESSKLNGLFQGEVKTFDELVVRLQALKQENFDLGDATEFLDKRTAATFLTLVEASDALGGMKEKLEDAGGAAQKMADIQMANLEGATLKLKSAQEGLSIAFSQRFAGALTKATEKIANFTTALAGAISPKMEEQVYRQRIEFEALVLALQNSAKDSEEYKSAQDELNLSFGDTVGYLDNQIDKYGDLEAAIKGMREELIEYNTNLLIQNEYNEQLKEAAKLNLEIKKDKRELYEVEAELALIWEGKSKVEELSFTQIHKSLGLTRKRLKLEGTILNNSREKLALNKEIADYAEAYKEELASTVPKAKEIKEEIKEIAKAEKDKFESTINRAKLQKDLDAEIAKDEKAAYDAEVKRMLDLNEEYKNFWDNKIATDMEKLNEKHSQEQALLAEARANSIISDEEYKAQTLIIEQEYSQQKLDIWMNENAARQGIFDAMSAGYDALVNSMLDKDMTGAERREAIWAATKKSFVSFLGEMLKQLVKNMIAQLFVSKTSEATAIASAAVTGQAIAASYAAAATLASLASFGANSAAAISGMLAAAATAKGIAIAEDGVYVDGKGGQLGGKPHSRGGTPIIAEKDEIILTKGVGKDPELRAKASALNVEGGGRSFAQGGIPSPTNITSAQRGGADFGAILRELQIISMKIGEMNPVIIIETSDPETRVKNDQITKENIEGSGDVLGDF